MKKIFLGITLLTLVFTACKSSKHADLEDGIYANIQTTKGDILVQLQHQATPVTVANFVSLAEGKSPFVVDSLKDKKFYDGLIFHRVMKDFMIQGGDPLGSGRGNPGYKFKFFITHKATPWLNGKHTIFGKVITGIEVVDSIANVKVSSLNKPDVTVVMNKVEIIRNGKEAKKFDAVQIMSDYFEEEKAEVVAFEKMKTDLLAEFKADEAKATLTDSGLLILKKEDGTGEQPKHGQKVMVSYDGYLMQNGTLFDSSNAELAEKFGILNPGRRDRGLYGPTAMDFSPEAPLAPGFKEGLLTMKVGDKIRIFVPPYLGYGDNTYGPIPGGSTLVFDLKIEEIAQ